MNWKEHKEQLLKDPEFKREYDALETEYRRASERIRTRLVKEASKKAGIKIEKEQNL